jgi:hypothetical protein
MQQVIFPVIMILAVICPAIGIPIYLGLRHDKWKRELEHKERMRALDLGRSLPGEEAPWSLARIGLMIATAVPMVIFACSTLASLVLGFQKDIWIAAGMVGMAAVICGSIVVIQSAQGVTRSTLRERFKQPIEDDAYDVVSARG